jgi:hypothetical protein
MKSKINKSNEIVPKVFEIAYGPCMGLKNFSIKIEDGKIISSDDFLLFPNSKEYIIPTEKEWQRFWRKMDRIDIWNWIKNYDPPINYGLRW